LVGLFQISHCNKPIQKICLVLPVLKKKKSPDFEKKDLRIVLSHFDLEFSLGLVALPFF
jgi:hypothetical protein